MCQSVFVYLSVTSRSSVETDERIGCLLARKLYSTCRRLCCKWIRVLPKIRVFTTVSFIQTLKKFRHAISIVERCYQLSSTKVDAETVINWTIVVKLTIPPSSDGRSFVYYIDRQALSAIYSTNPPRVFIGDSWCLLHLTRTFIAWYFVCSQSAILYVTRIFRLQFVLMLGYYTSLVIPDTMFGFRSISRIGRREKSTIDTK